ncbi:ABC exporter membrane fusion protein [Nodularia spumigena CS-584]|jgi:HlyD family secretion protein|uniref:p-hydroxybenzoic acid efflux pump subunit AaeA n=2 Tax=Nodularia spumigena TaxID=70799 RepID=A0A2S0Q8R1_NODSP|nr:ABC exporter membrane fusion protein [Nodularia spumigena]AHJ30929.1 heterocyst specific ABC-transporter, membrane fusion protein DevB-like protein [Nodularia spumigena CCY9414]AVZ30761.1 p-hydroxybenzoic acid efflux pump subunit AaeA [Nodularia spumigena UHCC 0039]EAW45164.1 Secretion protein HlyD [Nodularia spumigena CCY9414]MDB9382798.1 ABC exporter membrane fusion protein [Nodularia spumigena CS-584]MEA5523548.1 ABC exporter membrane fusion protein [Nodularia spumigena UHCC 0143]
MAANKKRLLFTKPLGRWRIILAASITLATGLVTFYSFSQNRFSPQVPTPSANLPKATPTPVKVAVTALGRLQPEGEVTNLSAPNSVNGVRVEKTLVKEGEEVKDGQILAYLENYGRATTALQQALDQLEIAKAKLAQVQSGAKPGDITAQKAAIARLESQLKGDIAAQQATINRIQAEVDNAQSENNRYQQLYKDGAISASIADSKALQLKTVQQQLTEAKANLNRTQNTLQDQLKEAKARLNSISEIRTVDVELAKTEVNSAVTAIKQAQADQELTYLKSPINGQVLKIHAKTGEVINSNGFAEIGKISQMYVVAEVYQTDIQKVKVGQKATITSNAFPGKIQGTVSKIGWQIDRQSIFSLNPAADTDRRIVEVKISINDPADSQRVARLTNLQVDVAIQL